jgi:hypothetical protein
VLVEFAGIVDVFVVLAGVVTVATCFWLSTVTVFVLEPHPVSARASSASAAGILGERGKGIT